MFKTAIAPSNNENGSNHNWYSKNSSHKRHFDFKNLKQNGTKTDEVPNNEGKTASNSGIHRMSTVDSQYRSIRNKNSDIAE